MENQNEKSLTSLACQYNLFGIVASFLAYYTLSFLESLLGTISRIGSEFQMVFDFILFSLPFVVIGSIIGTWISYFINSRALVKFFGSLPFILIIINFFVFFFADIFTQII